MSEINFSQPDPNTCLPTAWAYLLHRQGLIDFETWLPPFIELCYQRYPVAQEGLEFDQLQILAKEKGLATTISPQPPSSGPFLTGVSRLPRLDQATNDLIDQAVIENSIQLQPDFYYYPAGHAVAVFPQDKNKLTIFDSFWGRESELSAAELTQYLEQPVSYLFLSPEKNSRLE